MLFLGKQAKRVYTPLLNSKQCYKVKVPEKGASSITFILKEEVNIIFKMWKDCGISPTFLCLETHQGEIFSYVTAN